MKLNKPHITLVAALAGLPACASQPAEPVVSPDVRHESHSELCPSGEPKVIKFIEGGDPSQTYYEICGQRYAVIYTRNSVEATFTENGLVTKTKRSVLKSKTQVERSTEAAQDVMDIITEDGDQEVSE